MRKLEKVTSRNNILTILLRCLREEWQIPLVVMADSLRMTPEEWKKYEEGKKELTIEILSRFTPLIGLSLSALFYEIEIHENYLLNLPYCGNTQWYILYQSLAENKDDFSKEGNLYFDSEYYKELPWIRNPSVFLNYCAPFIFVKERHILEQELENHRKRQENRRIIL